LSLFGSDRHVQQQNRQHIPDQVQAPKRRLCGSNAREQARVRGDVDWPLQNRRHLSPHQHQPQKQAPAPLTHTSPAQSHHLRLPAGDQHGHSRERTQPVPSPVDRR